MKVKAAQANASKAKPKLKAAVAQNNHAPSSVSHQFEDPAVVEERNRLANMPPPPPPPQFQQPQVIFYHLFSNHLFDRFFRTLFRSFSIFF